MSTPSTDNWFRNRRLELGYTIRELAAKLMIAERTIQSWERDEVLPRRTRFVEICDAYQIDTETLVSALTQQSMRMQRRAA